MKFQSNILLLTTAAIWGLAFVAQRVGMEHIGPFAFNGIRFALGGLSLMPLILYYYFSDGKAARETIADTTPAWRIGLLAGTILFIAASLQQIGLIYTTAGKAAFITCLYIVLVPLAGVFLKQRIARGTWLGSILALTGLYLLCVKETAAISYGDFLELIGAGFWAAHILLIDRYARRINNLHLAFFQVMTCSVLSLVVAAATETITAAAVAQTAIPLLYGGICSVGIAYTLQIVGQKNADPAHAAIILSMETVFAVAGGWLILNEGLLAQEIIGCILMMSGMLVSQLCALKPNVVREEAVKQLAK